MAMNDIEQAKKRVRASYLAAKKEAIREGRAYKAKKPQASKTPGGAAKDLLPKVRSLKQGQSMQVGSVNIQRVSPNQYRVQQPGDQPGTYATAYTGVDTAWKGQQRSDGAIRAAGQASVQKVYASDAEIDRANKSAQSLSPIKTPKVKPPTGSSSQVNNYKKAAMDIVGTKRYSERTPEEHALVKKGLGTRKGTRAAKGGNETHRMTPVPKNAAAIKMPKKASPVRPAASRRSGTRAAYSYRRNGKMVHVPAKRM